MKKLFHTKSTNYKPKWLRKRKTEGKSSSYTTNCTSRENEESTISSGPQININNFVNSRNVNTIYRGEKASVLVAEDRQNLLARSFGGGYLFRAVVSGLVS